MSNSLVIAAAIVAAALIVKFAPPQLGRYQIVTSGTGQVAYRRPATPG
jgi:hypothetical protein